MPLKVESLTPEVAFAVEYQGKVIPIFHGGVIHPYEIKEVSNG